MSSDASALPRQSGRQPWRDTGETPLMIGLPAGDFVMGENDGDKFANDTERPAHRVFIPGRRAIGCFPVTAGEFRHFSPGHATSDADQLPVVNVNWLDAQAYCQWLTERAARMYRLPTEAEWEFACRAGSRTPFAGGDEITPAIANFLFDENGVRIGVGQRTPVGNYPPNLFGVYDLHGNVNEWVEDRWHPNYRGAPAGGEAWNETGGPGRVIRGGAWDYLPRLLRSAWRDWRPADHRADNIGFRVATNDS